MIRSAAPADVIRLAEIEQICFCDAWSPKLLAEGLSCQFDRYLVLENDDGIVGYGVLRILAGESELQRIAVLPGYRRQGYAWELLDWMVGISSDKGAKSMILEVRFSNQKARSLYCSYGFREEGIRRGYYQHPADDALLMRLSLV